jgi:hypothetical protein
MNQGSQRLVAEYSALLDSEVTPEEKAQVMGGNLLRLLDHRS